MNFCRSGVMVFIHPERVLREVHGVHCGGVPRAAASLNLSQRACGRSCISIRGGDDRALIPMGDRVATGCFT
jgi:hypothetical protein